LGLIPAAVLPLERFLLSEIFSRRLMLRLSCAVITPTSVKACESLAVIPECHYIFAGGVLGTDVFII
jgi:hypothetical protein